MTKFKPVKLTITTVEAPIELSGIDFVVHGSDWAEYDEKVEAIATLVCRKDDLGYSKTDFKLEFENGEVYEGRLDLKHPKVSDEFDGDRNVSHHIASFVGCYAGVKKPAHLSEADWKRFQNNTDIETVQEYLNFWNTYDLGPEQKGN